jgi:hypothetical protein
MRYLTLKNLIKLDFKIPNLNRLGLGEWTIDVHTDDDGNKEIIYYNNRIQVLRITYEPPRYYNYERLFTNYVDWNFFIDNGFILNAECDLKVILDSLYHFANPLKKSFNQLTAKQKEVWVSKFRTRTNKYQSYISGYTNKLLNEYIEYLDSSTNFTRPNLDTATLEYIKEYSTVIHDALSNIFYYDYFQYDLFKNKWFIRNSLDKIKVMHPFDGITQFYTSNLQAFIRHFNLTDHASSYTKVYYDSTKYVWYNDNLYKKEDVTLDTCNVCGHETISFEIIKDIGCSRCLKDFGKIHNYTTRVPTILTFKAKKIRNKFKPLYLGIELEYNSTNKSMDAKIAHKTLHNHAILKSDGSVPNGFEIVTCPAELDIHLESFKPFFMYKNTKTTLTDDRNTGMHVHISRDAIGPFSVGKMIAFFNNESNKTNLEKIGGRQLNNYCKQDSLRTFTYELNYGREGARYNILNTNNVATVEIRMFSTPKTYEEFASKVEFADAISRYCSPANVNLPPKELIKFDNFKVFAMKNRKSYPNLFNVIKGL